MFRELLGKKNVEMDERLNKDALHQDEDALLITEFLSGKHAEFSFEQLVLKYKDRIFNLCFRFLGNYAEADDSAQEVFLKVYRSLKCFRFQSSFSTWLYRIAVNTWPRDQKEVVVLRDIELLSYEEIAKIAGLNIGTVKSKLSRARRLLREKLRRFI